MFAANLAIIFGPTLLRPPPISWSKESAGLVSHYDGHQDTMNEMKHLGKCSSIVKHLILQSAWIFDES